MANPASAPARTTIRVAVWDERNLIAEALATLISGLDGFVGRALPADAGPRGGGVEDADVLLLAVGAEPEDVRALPQRAGGGRASAAGAAVVILADRLDPALVELVLEQRLSGLLLSQCSAADFATSMRQIAHGHAVLPAGWQQVIATERADPIGSLSERQRDVLALLAEGLSYEEIGARLFISTNTVKFHVRTIFVRLGVRNRTAAARAYARYRPAHTPSPTHPH